MTEENEDGPYRSDADRWHWKYQEMKTERDVLKERLDNCDHASQRIFRKRLIAAFMIVSGILALVYGVWIVDQRSKEYQEEERQLRTDPNACVDHILGHHHKECQSIHHDMRPVTNRSTIGCFCRRSSK